MKAFISYSHKDVNYLERLHVHLVQLKRDNLIDTWTDEAILAGDKLDKSISTSLTNSNLFMALLSPDYIGSSYCYEKEFEKALEMQEDGQLIIIPIILEPCDWLSTPFNQFKALPKDGKPISDWSNMNTAFLGVIQGIRNLLKLGNGVSKKDTLKKHPLKSLKNYKIQKDFDSIEKMEFVENGFKDLKNHLEDNITELVNLENIKARTLINNNNNFECLIVNRNKVNTEATLTITKSDIRGSVSVIMQSYTSTNHQLVWSIVDKNGQKTQESFDLNNDDFNMFWKRNSRLYRQDDKKLNIKDMADIIWEAWLKSVGIEF